MRNATTRRRLLGAALAVAVAGILGGCHNLLDVRNPGAIEAEKLNDIYYVNLLTNGAVGEFQQMHGQVSKYAAVFGDELRNAHTFYENQDIDMRNMTDANGTMGLYVFGAMHRARFMADSVAGRLKVLLADSAGRDLRLARVLAYSGYTYVYLGEQMCSSPVNVSKAYSDDELLGMAPPRFDEAITVASAARAWALSQPTSTAMTTLINGTDSVINFARVGAARAYLDLDDKAKAIQYASAVTPVWASDAAPGFQFWVWFLENTVNNPWYAAAATAAGSGSREVSLDHTPWENVQDIRIPQKRMAVMDKTAAPNGPMVPLSPSGFSTYNGTLAGGEFTRSSAMRLASALEARYILAEAQGLGADNLAFLNNRRSLAGLGPLDMSVTATMYRDALIEQRARDFFIDGHRLGDLRRYQKHYNLDFWPSGPYPGSSTGAQYGTQTCWPLPIGEKTYNPNLGG